MKLAANRTQVDAFRASFQALLKNVIVPDCIQQLAPEIELNRTMKCIIVLVVGGTLNQLLI